LLVACAAPGEFPGTSEWLLDEDGEAEWQSKVNYRSGRVLLRFEPADQQCGVRFAMHLAESKEARLTHEVDVYLRGSHCSGQLDVHAAHFDTPVSKISSYYDAPLLMAETNTVDIRWVGRKHLSIAVNGEPLLQEAPLARSFHFLKIVAHVGAIKILELSHE
jgi:hypothetical protein